MTAHRLLVLIAVFAVSVLSVSSAAPASGDVAAAAKEGDRAELEELLTDITAAELETLVKAVADDLSGQQLAAVINAAIGVAIERAAIARTGFSAAMEAKDSDPDTAKLLMSSLTLDVYTVSKLENDEALAVLQAAARGAVEGSVEANQPEIARQISTVAVGAAPGEQKSAVGENVRDGAVAGAVVGQRAAVQAAAAGGAGAADIPRQAAVQPASLDDVPVSGQ